MKIVSVQQLRAIEKAADQNGLSYFNMMNNAGTNLGNWIDTTFQKKTINIVVGFVGGGNNGGDTLIALTYLAKRGWSAFAYLVKPRKPDEQSLQNFLSVGGKVTSVDIDISRTHLTSLISHAGIILDGMLGIGYKPPLSNELDHFMKKLSDIIGKHPLKPKIIAVDCASGVDCTSGMAEDCTLTADYTACMAAVKSGLMLFPAFSYCGSLIEIPIGLPDGFPMLQEIKSEVFCIENSAEIFPKRLLNSHKGTYGSCVIFAGSSSYPGAAYLAGKAAYLSGAGLVSMIAHPELRNSLSGALPEAVWSDLPKTEADLLQTLYERSKSHSSFLVGPGIGTSSEAKFLFNSIFSLYKSKFINLPLVIDAEGLRLLKRIRNWWTALPKETVLTPHPGEMSDLCELSISEIQSSRIEAASLFAEKWQKTIVLKGAITIIADPKGNTYSIPVATPALSTAGTGDTLAGLIAGFLAQGMQATEASLLSTSIHAKAGLLAEEEFNQNYSPTAGIILKKIPEAISYLKKQAPI